MVKKGKLTNHSGVLLVLSIALVLIISGCATNTPQTPSSSPSLLDSALNAVGLGNGDDVSLSEQQVSSDSTAYSPGETIWYCPTAQSTLPKYDPVVDNQQQIVQGGIPPPPQLGCCVVDAATFKAFPTKAVEQKDCKSPIWLAGAAPFQPNPPFGDWFCPNNQGANQCPCGNVPDANGNCPPVCPNCAPVNPPIPPGNCGPGPCDVDVNRNGCLPATCADCNPPGSNGKCKTGGCGNLPDANGEYPPVCPDCSTPNPDGTCGVQNPDGTCDLPPCACGAARDENGNCPAVCNNCAPKNSDDTCPIICCDGTIPSENNPCPLPTSAECVGTKTCCDGSVIPSDKTCPQCESTPTPELQDPIFRQQLTTFAKTQFCPEIPKENLDDTSISCACVLDGQDAYKLSASITSLGDIKIPAGYDLISPPFKWDCNKDAVDFSLSVSDNYEDIKVLRCDDRGCSPLPSIDTSEELLCQGKPVTGEEKDSLTAKATLLPEDFRPLPPQRVIITDKNNRYEYGGITYQFSNIATAFTATFSSPSKELPNLQNPSMSFFSIPVTLNIDPLPPGLRVSIDYGDVSSSNAVQGTLELYAAGNSIWNKLTSASKWSGNAAGEMTTSIVGLRCDDCVESRLTEEYNGGGRNAVILVHGLLSRPDTWNSLTEHIKLSKQSYQVWTYAYPLDSTLEKSSADLASLLDQQAGKFDNIIIVSHSVGGLVVQQALQDSYQKKLPSAYLRKVKGVVLVASPNKGSEGLKEYDILNQLRSERTNIPLFPADAPLLQYALDGKFINPIRGINYYVVAGTKPFDFELITSKPKITAPFDGVVTTDSAQQLGNTKINDKCNNYFELYNTHTELIDDLLPQRVIGQLISNVFTDTTATQAYFGYNQYVHGSFSQCDSGDKFVVIGKLKSGVSEVPGCECGDGVCGIGETEVNCPSDCSLKVRTCDTSNIIFWILLVILMILTALIEVRAHILKESLPIMPLTLTWIVLIASIVALIIHSVLCEFDPWAFGLLTLTAFILATGRWHRSHILENAPKKPSRFLPAEKTVMKISKPVKLEKRTAAQMKREMKEAARKARRNAELTRSARNAVIAPVNGIKAIGAGIAKGFHKITTGRKSSENVLEELRQEDKDLKRLLNKIRKK